MINDFDLTPEEIKQQYPEDVVKKAETFKTKGVSLKEAEDYLRTEEGKLYFDRLAEADPTLAQENPKKIFDRAVGQIRSGTDLPRMEIMNEPLVQLVPAGGKPPSDSMPFWIKEADFQAAIAEGKNLSKSFALPIGSESAQYDVYKITPKVPTEVFISTVAPSTEFDGQVVKAGGATQYLTPNRALYEKPEFVTTVQNRVFIPHQKDLQIPSDLKNPAIQTIDGIHRTELATMSDELIAQGYSQSKAFEAVNSALKERLATSASQNLGIVFEAKIIMKNDVAYVEFSAPSMEKMGMDKQDFPIKNLKTSVKEALKEGLSLYLENQVLSEKNRPKFSQIDAAGLKLKLENSRNFSKDLQKALDLKLEKIEDGFASVYRVHARELNLRGPEYDAQHKKEFGFQAAEVEKIPEIKKPKKSMEMEM